MDDFQDQDLAMSKRGRDDNMAGGMGGPFHSSPSAPNRIRKKRHLTEPSEANFHCGKCGKYFSRIWNYNAHLETHDPHRPRPHVCLVDDCKKAFVRRTDLTRHQQCVGSSRLGSKQPNSAYTKLTLFTGARQRQEIPLRTLQQHVCPQRYSKKVRIPPPPSLPPPIEGRVLTFMMAQTRRRRLSKARRHRIPRLEKQADSLELASPELLHRNATAPRRRAHVPNYARPDIL
jgi:hypothetical protein